MEHVVSVHLGGEREQPHAAAREHQATQEKIGIVAGAAVRDSRLPTAVLVLGGAVKGMLAALCPFLSPGRRPRDGIVPSKFNAKEQE